MNKLTAKLLKRIVTILILATFIFVGYSLCSKAYAGTSMGTVNDPEGVWMRSQPSTKAQIIAGITYNTRVEITGEVTSEGREWYRINYNGKSGFAAAEFITKDSTGSDGGSSGGHVSGDYTNTYGIVNSSDGLNVRSGPGAGYAYLGTLNDGAQVKVNGAQVNSKGEKWYEIVYAGKKAFVISTYMNLMEIPPYIPEENFEAQLESQGFPESYKVLLRKIHAQYPKWVFVAGKTGFSWDHAISKEYRFISGSRVNTINDSFPDSWKSMEDGDYDFNRKVYKEYDSGGYVAASKGIIKYYMDPRNFLNTTDVFQFISSKYNSALHTSSGLQAMLNGTFMSGSVSDPNYRTYNDILMEAARQSQVSPYTLATMILEEQGRDGHGKSISGKVSGFEGLYNFFNIRAYQSGNYDAVQYGLLYARERGWTTRSKSIIEGAKWFNENYVSSGQYTQYLKKFNVMNGASAVGSGQYMTNISGAYQEGSSLKTAYAALLNTALEFEIPVYENMPSSAAPLPTRNGNNNNFLDSITVNGKSVPSFNRFTYTYNVDVGDATSIAIDAKLNESAAKIEGLGTKKLNAGNNKFEIVVTSTSGEKRIYTVNVKTTGSGSEGNGMPEYRLLKKGMQGEDVKYFQNILFKNGYLDDNYISGIFDERTRNAVILFQAYNGLDSPDGMIGRWTRNVIEKGVDSFSIVLNGKNDVNYILQTELQEKGYLLVQPDGYIGRNTRNGIKAFNFAKGCNVDDEINLSTVLDVMDDEQCIMINNLSGVYRLGSENQDIARIKARMSLFGFDTLKNGCLFDRDFQREINIYQTLGGLQSDGVFGGWSARNLNSGNIYNASVSYGSKYNLTLGTQQLLRDVCELKVTPDGIFGRNTYSAIKTFQSKFNLPISGIADYTTLKKLVEVKHESLDANYVITCKNLIKQGNRGADVLVVQRKLNALGYLYSTPDGIFGYNTYNALMRFQKDNGIAADGICGENTILHLNKH